MDRRDKYAGRRRGSYVRTGAILLLILVVALLVWVL